MSSTRLRKVISLKNRDRAAISQKITPAEYTSAFSEYFFPIITSGANQTALHPAAHNACQQLGIQRREREGG